MDSKIYREWFIMAKKDLTSSKILFEHDADYGIVCFHCQQTIEKYFKGYLICKAGELVEGHNLVKLCKKVMQYDKSFKLFIKECAFVNTFYIETRYPEEDPLIVSGEEVEECFRIAHSIGDKVEEAIK
ncbi:MAG: HEPN domain-containing protein [Clostridia bacterium]|nr:HEPN domain-containing protein [Clostridia bacterium]